MKIGMATAKDTAKYSGGTSPLQYSIEATAKRTAPTMYPIVDVLSLRGIQR
jgi:hypothetical protein